MSVPSLETEPSAETLLAVVEAIHRSLELPTLGAAYMTVIPQVVRADAYGLYVGDPATHAPRRIAMRGATDRFVRRYEAEGFACDPLLDHATRTLEPVHDAQLFSADEWQDQPLRHTLAMRRLVRMLEAPFGRDGRVLGTMYFTRHPDAPAFGERDLDALTVVTRHMVTAVEHCHAYRAATASAAEAAIPTAGTMAPPLDEVTLRSPADRQFDHLQGVVPRREVQVLELVARGLTTAGIARRLYLSPNTVKYHLKQLFAALDVSSRAELIAKALALREQSHQPH